LKRQQLLPPTRYGAALLIIPFTRARHWSTWLPSRTNPS